MQLSDRKDRHTKVSQAKRSFLLPLNDFRPTNFCLQIHSRSFGELFYAGEGWLDNNKGTYFENARVDLAQPQVSLLFAIYSFT